MSSHSFPKIDQKEYLKKYLSGDKAKKRKKDKKHHKKSGKDAPNVKIIDDDVNYLDTGPQIDEELLLTGEDAPQIVAEYIEDTPVEQKLPKWKSIVIKDEPEDDEGSAASQNERELWGRKTNELKIKKEYSSGGKRSNRTPDNSPLRKKQRRRKSPSSSPRRRHQSRSPTRVKQTKNSYESPDRRMKMKTEPLSPALHENFSKKTQKHDDTSSTRRRNKSEQSPPRRRRNSSSTDSSPIQSKRQKNLTPDNSPPRRTRKPSHSPPRTQSHNKNSPPRGRKNCQHSPARKENNNSSYRSPTRNGRTCKQTSPRRERKQTPDNSPRRRRRNSSESPPRTSRRVNKSPSRDRRNLPHSPLPQRHRASSDQSPPRKSKRSVVSSEFRSPAHYRKDPDASSSGGRNTDQSPPRRRQNRRDSDQSPPRKQKQRKETPVNSPARKSKKSLDQSPPRRRCNSDQSPPRRKRKNSLDTRIKQEKRTPDLSPIPNARSSRWEKQEPEKSPSPPPTHKPKAGTTLEGKKAGLQNAEALQRETKERRQKEDQLFESMPAELSGRNAEVQVRSTGRKGRRAREAAEEDPEERRRKAEHEEKKKQQYDRWGKGLKQIEDHKNRMLQQEYESNKPLARYANDEDLERHLKEQERAEDPMLEYMRQKRKEKEKLSGKPEIPRYKGPYPENRFGIAPGYRWDGVDRSNGYEKKYFEVQNAKRARQDEAYKYSVEDM